MRSETFKTAGDVRLDLEIPAGRIEIATADTDETHVELEALSDSMRDLVEEARIESTRRGDHDDVIVSVRERRGFFLSFDRAEILLRVTCPYGAELDIRTRSADVEAHGQYASAEIKTASGDVELQEAHGDVRVKTASGDVRVETVRGRLDVNSASGDLSVDNVGGEASVQLVSGDLYIREAGDSVRTNTVSGDQRLENVSKGRMDLRAISGDIGVGVRRGSRVYVDANTVSGATSSELDLGDAPSTSREDDAPLVELFAKTVSGDVRIERA